MKQGWQSEPFFRPLLLLLIFWTHFTLQNDDYYQGEKKFGDRCDKTEECGFKGSICNEYTKTCQCKIEFPITNHLDKCGIAVKVNESCFFNEQCEAVSFQTECRDGLCACKFQMQGIVKPDGKVECINVQNKHVPEKYVDPAMIGILVAMFLMFITICVVLRLFSRARWRENRTIFNTPNPRLMNVSLLRENKLLHQDRRGSRSSARGPSRPPSMASLRAHSPNSQGSRRGSKGSSNASATSAKSTKSPPQQTATNVVTSPMLENVTIEVQETKE